MDPLDPNRKLQLGAWGPLMLVFKLNILNSGFKHWAQFSLPFLAMANIQPNVCAKQEIFDGNGYNLLKIKRFYLIFLFISVFFALSLFRKKRMFYLESWCFEIAGRFRWKIEELNITFIWILWLAGETTKFENDDVNDEEWFEWIFHCIRFKNQMIQKYWPKCNANLAGRTRIFRPFCQQKNNNKN